MDPEEQDIQTKIVLRERLVDKNSWQHYVYYQADTNVP